MKTIRKAFGRKSKQGSSSATEEAAAAIPSASTQDANTLKDDEEEQSNESKALSELNSAVTKFKNHYGQFAQKNRQFLRVDHDVHQAIEKAGKEQDIKRSAGIFGKEINATLQVTERKRDISNCKWTGKLSNFIIKLYPVARLSLRLTSAIADVIP